MSHVTVSLPDALESFVNDEVAAHGLDSSDTYIRSLIARERDRQMLRNLLLEGQTSPIVGLADDAYFDSLRTRVRSAT